MLNQLLRKFDLNYEDLKPAERETLNSWLEALAKRELTVEKVKDFIASLAANAARELSEIPDPGTLSYFIYRYYWKKRDIYLRARLKNYLMIQDFMTGPDKARRWIEDQISQIK